MISNQEEKKFCVYLTTYAGDKLPKFYIGSTRVDKIVNGYIGSVSSAKYSDIWNSERKLNRHLFSVEVLSYHETRESAYVAEKEEQVKVNAHMNPDYTNLSIAGKKFHATQEVIDKRNLTKIKENTAKNAGVKVKETWANMDPEYRQSIYDRRVITKLKNGTCAKSGEKAARTRETRGTRDTGIQKQIATQTGKSQRGGGIQVDYIDGTSFFFDGKSLRGTSEIINVPFWALKDIQAERACDGTYLKYGIMRVTRGFADGIKEANNVINREIRLQKLIEKYNQ